MSAYLVTAIIDKIRSDQDHLNDRRVLHENYEWLENFWRSKYGNGNSSINDFINEKAHFFWQKNEVKSWASALAVIECVGSNSNQGYIQSGEIASAIMYLRNYSGLFNGNIPDCNFSNCRHYKLQTGLCTPANGRLWKVIDNDEQASFKAVMYIIRQIRNNLFHGHKMTLEIEQFGRDKFIVAIAALLTSFILSNLVASGG